MILFRQKYLQTSEPTEFNFLTIDPIIKTLLPQRQSCSRCFKKRILIAENKMMIMRWSDPSEGQYNMKSSKYLDISILFHRLFKYSKSTQGFFELSQIVIYQLYSFRSLSQK